MTHLCKKNILLYVGHPFDLAFFYRLLPQINKVNDLHVTTIIAKGRYFRDFDNLESILANFSDEIIIIPENKIPSYQRNFIKIIRSVIYLKNKISAIDKTETILISLDKSTFMANYLNSHFKRVILIQTEAKNLDLINNYRLDKIRMTWFNLINFLSGSRYIRLYHNKDSNDSVYHYEIINDSSTIVYRSSNENINNRIVLAPIPAGNKSKKIVIFGSRYNTWNYMKPNFIHNKKAIFEFYEYLKQMYADYSVYYKPHPKEMGTEFNEINSIFNNKLINVGIRLNSELFLLENPDIEFCFSLCSTSSMSAYEMGFSSKIFKELLIFPQSIKVSMDNTFQDAPAEFFIQNLDESVKKPCINDSIQEKLDFFLQSLDKLNS